MWILGHKFVASLRAACARPARGAPAFAAVGARGEGRKRHIAVDTCGLLLAVLVTVARVQDRDAARPLLWALHMCFLSVRLVWAGSGYADRLVGWVMSRPATRLNACPVVKRVAELAAGAVDAAEITLGQLAGVYCIGGGAVMPAVARQVQLTSTLHQIPATRTRSASVAGCGVHCHFG